MTSNKVTCKHSRRKIFKRKSILFLYIRFLKPFTLLRVEAVIVLPEVHKFFGDEYAIIKTT